MHLISLRLLAHRYIGVFVKIHERSAQTVNGNVGQPERSFSATEHMLKTSMHCMGVYKRMGSVHCMGVYNVWESMHCMGMYNVWKTQWRIQDLGSGGQILENQAKAANSL